MLKPEENERLTRVGPGTPMGDLLRRYWQPIAVTGELANNPVKPVRILGEDLTLFRARGGHLGLIGQRCAHRLVDLRCGIPTQDGLKCAYHGWTYDPTGQCIDQPAESPEHRFKERVRLRSYPVQELGGLVWAYLGPQPPPLIPRWFPLVAESACSRLIRSSRKRRGGSRSITSRCASNLSSTASASTACWRASARTRPAAGRSA